MYKIFLLKNIGNFWIFKSLNSFVLIVLLQLYIIIFAFSNVDILLDFVWTVELNRFGLELVGLWPKTDEVTKDNYASDLRVGIIFVIIMFVSGIPLVWALIRVRNDMILVVDNLQITLPVGTASVNAGRGPSLTSRALSLGALMYVSVATLSTSVFRILSRTSRLAPVHIHVRRLSLTVYITS